MPAITFFKPVAKDRKQKQRYGIAPKIRVGPATLGVITLLIVLLMSLLYLMQANSTATKGYEIEKQQEKMKKLESQAEKLELEMARLRSTKELDSIPEKLNLKPFAEDAVNSFHFETAGAVARLGEAPGGTPPEALATEREAQAGVTADKDGRNPKR